MESVPRWEYRYLRNALSRDPGVDVSCLLFQPGLARRGGGDVDRIPGGEHRPVERADDDLFQWIPLVMGIDRAIG